MFNFRQNNHRECEKKPKVNVLANKKYRCVNNTGVEKYASVIGRKGVCHGKKEGYTSSSGSAYRRREDEI